MSSQGSNHGIHQVIKRAEFKIGDTRMIVEDRVNRLMPAFSERILRIAGTSIYYSVVPLSSSNHRLLCYNYCEDALKERKPSFYRHALVLGCGGGAIPRWLLEEYSSVVVDVVDISRDMIEVCKEYFLDEWEDSGRLKYHCIDALDYMPPVYEYQFIFCDLFSGTELAPPVFRKDFAAKLHNMICEDGILVINCGWGHQNEVRRIFQTQFEYVQIVERDSWQTEVIKAGDTPFRR